MIVAYIVTESVAGTKQGGTVNTSFLDVDGVHGIIEAAGATFLANEVQRGDGLNVLASTTNDDLYIVHTVLSETRVIVVASAGGTPLVTEPVAGVLIVQGANHRLTITDETITSALDVETGIGRPELFEVGRSSAGSGQQYLMIRHRFSEITLASTGGTFAWSGTREVWSRDSTMAVVGTSAGGLVVSGPAIGAYELEFGELAVPANSRSYRNGCVWIGVIFNGPQNSMRQRYYGCYLSVPTAASLHQVNPGNAGEGRMFGCVANGGIVVGSGANTVDGSSLIDVLHVSETFGFAPLNRLNDVSNFVQAASTSFAIVAFLPPGLDVSASGLAFSDDAFSPVFLLTLNPGAAFNIDDQQEDRSSAFLLNSVSDSTARIRYSWSPRVVTAVRPSSELAGGNGEGSEITTPVQGAMVYVDEVDLNRRIDVAFAASTAGNYVVTINGTDHVYASPGGETPATVSGALVALLNVVGEPVSAITAGLPATPTVLVSPDVVANPMSVSVSSPVPGELSVRSFVIPVTGSPFATAADGRINGGAALLVVRYEDEAFTLGPNNRVRDNEFRVRITAPGYREHLRQMIMTHQLDEDIEMVSWSPNRRSPQR